jgi:hypothetical protein
MDVNNQTNNLIDTSLSNNPTPPTNKPKSFNIVIVIIFLVLLSALVISVLYILKLKTEIKKLPENNQSANNQIEVSPTNAVVSAEDVNKSAIYYVKDNVLYKQSPLDSSPSIFLNRVEAYAFSPDNQKIAYIIDSGEAGSTEINDVHIRNLETNNETTIKSEYGINRGLSWSPDGAYLLVDAGTSPEGVLTVYDSSTGKEISLMGSGSYLWFDNQNLYISQETKVDPERPWENGSGFSLVKVNVITGNEEIIKKADSLTDYEIGNTIDSSCLYYSSRSVSNQSDWEDNNKAIITNYCYDLKTGESRLTADPGTTESLQIKKIIKQLIPDYTDTYYFQFVKNTKYKDWVIVWVHDNASNSDANIVIFDLNNPQTTYEKIATGANSDISWY